MLCLPSGLPFSTSLHTNQVQQLRTALFTIMVCLFWIIFSRAFMTKVSHHTNLFFFHTCEFMMEPIENRDALRCDRLVCENKEISIVWEILITCTRRYVHYIERYTIKKMLMCWVLLLWFIKIIKKLENFVCHLFWAIFIWVWKRILYVFVNELKWSSHIE